MVEPDAFAAFYEAFTEVTKELQSLPVVCYYNHIIFNKNDDTFEFGAKHISVDYRPSSVKMIDDLSKYALH